MALLGSGTVVNTSGATISTTITLTGEYHLGEAGSVGAAPFFSPLVDSEGVMNNVTVFQNAPTGHTQFITSAGLAAPGSTAALVISGNAGGNSGWHGNSRPYGYTDNWAIDLWVRPDNSEGTFLGATANNGATALRFHVSNTMFTATSLGGNFLEAGNNYLMMRQANGQILGSRASTYVVGQWNRITAFTLEGTSYYYLNGVYQDSGTFDTTPILDDPLLGFAPGGVAGTNAAFDEMRVFDISGATLQQVLVDFGFVPEPSTVSLLVLGGLLVLRRRR